MLMASAIASNIRCTDTERKALLRFKQSLVDESNVLSSWESQRDCCKWKGITCDNQTSHVTKLDLHFILDYYSHVQPLAGEISLSLLQLPYLNYLDLSFNSFEGLRIPSFIGSLNRLKHFKIAGAGFMGSIPTQLGNLSNLHTLDLSWNSAVSTNNLEWLSRLSSLRILNMSGLNLSEAVSWPQSISKLSSLIELRFSSCDLPDVNPKLLPLLNSSTSLQVVDISSNFLKSPIFFWLVNVSSNLLRIELMECGLQGPIPNIFTNMVSLEYLDLSINNLEGGLPRSFQNLCSLESLNLWSNNLSDRLHDSMENWSCIGDTLKHLYLTGNPFWGPFPNLTSFLSLVSVHIEGTKLSGSLPEDLGSLSKLQILSLVDNQFTGSIPDLTGLSSLKMLFLSKNKLNGSVPESMGQISSLEMVDLSSNSLEGVITEVHFLNLSRLQYLAISENPLSINFSSDWIPPFQLRGLVIMSCKVGPAFPKWIQRQRKLHTLYITNAGISDSIPNEFWDLSSSLIELNLSFNQIHGKLPNLSSKNYTYLVFDLSSNSLHGPLPPFSSNISTLILSKNMISGSLSSLCAMETPRLSHLDLSDNLLSGELPNCWMQFQQMINLNLAKNNFSGKIPHSMGYMQDVAVLRLQDNNFLGEMPSLENCTELGIVDFGRNKLTGRIPEWIGKRLSKLIILRLPHNKFIGSLPSSLCNLPALQNLDLSHNRISGFLPQCLDNLTAMYSEIDVFLILGLVEVVWKRLELEFGSNLMHLRSIDISSNYLTGTIPDNITSMYKLISLNLSRNNLKGSIPGKFGRLHMLESLDLSRNQISGNIPKSFSDLTFLGVLDLAHNNLSGKIPLSTQLQGFNASTYMGNEGLCGKPLIKRCPGDETEEGSSTEPNDVEEADDDDGFVSFGFYLSIGIGYFVGLWGLFGPLLLKRSWRNTYFKLLNDAEDWIYVKTRTFKVRAMHKRH